MAACLKRVAIILILMTFYHGASTFAAPKANVHLIPNGFQIKSVDYIEKDTGGKYKDFLVKVIAKETGTEILYMFIYERKKDKPYEIHKFLTSPGTEIIKE